jgi:hypothetical protein
MFSHLLTEQAVAADNKYALKHRIHAVNPLS